MRHEHPAAGPVELYTELQSGDLAVTAEPRDTVVVEVTGAHADEVVVTAEDNRVSIVEPRRAGFLLGRRDVQVAVRVPSTSRLVAKLGSMSLRATGELGHVRVATGAGDITLGTVTDTAVVKTGAGHVAIDSLAAEAQIKSGAGTITVGRVSAPAKLTTGAGAIEVQEARAPLVLKSGSGDLSVGATCEDATLSAASGDLRIGRLGRGQVSLKNVSGNIRLGIPEGTPVWTDISTGTGRVRSTLTPTGAPAEDQDHVEVRARSVSGDIYLERLEQRSPDTVEGQPA